uniref:Uncharacterized protein n=1 Tax=Solanum tuberosum TaxID=4113 RepID=M1C963_SOLTU
MERSLKHPIFLKKEDVEVIFGEDEEAWMADGEDVFFGEEERDFCEKQSIGGGGRVYLGEEGSHLPSIAIAKAKVVGAGAILRPVSSGKQV